jgi:anti-sigma regulatory factor (Ser/Thr protein kinase)
LIIEVPPSARLQNLEAFARRVSEGDDPSLTLLLPDSYFSLHPVALSAIATAGLRALRLGAPVTIPNLPDTNGVRYLERMGLFRLLQVPSEVRVFPREEAGRFVPLTVIRRGSELSKFVSDLVPLFHTDTRRAEPIQYVISELVRNTLEHSGANSASVVAAQLYKSGTVAVGVADIGDGIRSSLARSYRTKSDLDAIQLALRPGVTGTTRRLGGTEDNAGAGLFFCKSLAFAGANYFVIHSGTGFYKLLQRRTDSPLVIHGDATRDRATRYSDMNSWPGTLVGIDLDTGGETTFSMILNFISREYDVDVRAEKKSAHKKKARFA